MAQGLLQIQANGETYQAKGDFTYNLGIDKRDAIVGADNVHDYSEVPQVPFIEGAITDNIDLNVKELQAMNSITVTLALRNGKNIVLQGAWYAHEGTVNVAQGEIPVRWEGITADEV